EVWAQRDQETAWAPGTKFWYSNAGFKTIGLILERVTGQPFTQLLQERIFEPLGMAITEPAIVNSIRPRSAVGYTRLYDDRIADRRQPFVQAIWSESNTADGAISSTAEDMAAYARAIMNGGSGLVSDGSFALMTGTYVNDPEDPADAYGYGLKTRNQDGRTILGHSGGMVGYTSGMWIEDGIGLVILQNCELGSWWLAPDALAALTAATKGSPLPPVPEVADPATVVNASDYAGIYRRGERAFTLEAEGSRVTLDGIALERVHGDTFFVPAPEWDMFLLSFSRDAGQVTEAVYGPEVFTNARHSGYASPTPYPVDWDDYPGHYRCHNPWGSNVRVFIRRGALWAAFSSIDLSDFEYRLEPMANGAFTLGETPERMSFDTIISGRAMRTVLMGQEMFRTFTP
ncbi:MAG: serine hydrolase, partial [Actinobacteria bacterium]|nr:serine hydrolase [Actinomycetota bacterium]